MRWAPRGSISLALMGVLLVVGGYALLGLRVWWLHTEAAGLRAELQVERNRVLAFQESEKRWSTALANQQQAVDRIKADSARRAQVSSEAFAAVESRAKAAEAREAAIMAAPLPQPGEDRCAAACRLLRSPLLAP